MQRSGVVRPGQDPRAGVWETPDWLFRPLNELLGFELDCAALPGNAKCPRFYTPKDDALKQSWDAPAWFCNPPFGQNPGTGSWVAKARSEAWKYDAIGVMVLPVKADSAWWHDEVWGWNRVQASGRLDAGRLSGRWYQLDHSPMRVELLELRGRISYGGADGTGWSASAILVLNSPRLPILPRLGPLSQ